MLIQPNQIIKVAQFHAIVLLWRSNNFQCQIARDDRRHINICLDISSARYIYIRTQIFNAIRARHLNPDCLHVCVYIVFAGSRQATLMNCVEYLDISCRYISRE